LANSQPYLAILIALETGMRQGEILNLRWDDMDADREVISIRDAKNGHNRQVVMSDRLAAHLATVQRNDNGLFSITSSGLQQAFRKLTRRLQMHDLRFHDLRHEAISAFFERGLTVPEVQLMSGHRTLDQLMRYAHATSQAVKSKINQDGPLLDKVLSAKQACDWLNISRTTLYRITNSGDVPKIKLSPRRVGWRINDLIRYVEANKVVCVQNREPT
jgi:integrase/predicted DNA-binding transcriptional regulator AlpA